MYRLIARIIMGLFSSNKVYGRTWQEDKALRQPLSKDEDYNSIEDIEVVVGEYGLSARISCKEGDVFKSLDKETSGNVLVGEHLDKSRCFLCVFKRGSETCEKLHYSKD